MIFERLHIILNPSSGIFKLFVHSVFLNINFSWNCIYNSLIACIFY